MDLENLAYALVQVVHNFGAAAVVGAGLFAFWPLRQSNEVRHRLAWLVLGAWAVQALSGMLFGAVSFYAYGQLPDIHGIAVAALGIKIACALLGLLIAALYLRRAGEWTEKRRFRSWHALAGLGALALTAAAFLRWFS